jgi:hypothetical protein
MIHSYLGNLAKTHRDDFVRESTKVSGILEMTNCESYGKKMGGGSLDDRGKSDH